jgi:hypothetical protein
MRRMLVIGIAHYLKKMGVVNSTKM